jgi:hypothetical protein
LSGGELQTKDRKAKLVIEEFNGGSNIKQVMKKVWVQMAKLPSELRDYLTIWVIGTILGVTKDVDMIFMRQYNHLRMQVLVLDPALIPSSVDVVIGDNIYELHFRVEPEDMQDAPKPLDMEDDNDEFDKKEEEGAGGGDQGDYMQEDRSLDSVSGRKSGANSNVSHDANQGKKKVQNTAADENFMQMEVSQQENWDSEVQRDETDAYIEDELMGNFEMEGRGDEPVSPEVESPSRKSKRRAQSSDEHYLDRATRIKATHNLDFLKEKGNSPKSLAFFIHYLDEQVVGNLSVVGVSLGSSDNIVSSLVSHIKEIELGRLEGAANRDKISEFFDKEEKKEMENEEVDKLITNSLCCEIMDEVMDLGNAYPKDCKITLKHKLSCLGKK